MQGHQSVGCYSNSDSQWKKHLPPFLKASAVSPRKLVGDSRKATFGSNMPKLDHIVDVFHCSKPSPETKSTVYVKSLQMEE